MKIWAYVILAGLVIGALTATYKVIDRAGYNRAVNEQQAVAIKAQNKAIEDARKEWEKTQVAAEKEIIIEEKIVEKIRVVTKEVPKIVEKFVAAECRDLGPEFAGLLNDAVRASNSRSDTSAEVTNDVDATL